MGLDMYLNARKSIYQREWAPEGEPVPEVKKIDGMKITGYEMQAAYWRKHPDLHGFIVANCEPADPTGRGERDRCDEIPLTADQLRVIAAAIRYKRLPKTTGFFFGDSDWHKDEAEKDAKTFETLAAWLEAADTRNYESRNAYYQASW
jgi:hypothetical protein